MSGKTNSHFNWLILGCSQGTLAIVKKLYNFRRYPVKDFRFEVNVLVSFGEESICSEKMKKKSQSLAIVQLTI